MNPLKQLEDYGHGNDRVVESRQRVSRGRLREDEEDRDEGDPDHGDPTTD